MKKPRDRQKCGELYDAIEEFFKQPSSGLRSHLKSSLSNSAEPLEAAKRFYNFRQRGYSALTLRIIRTEWLKIADAKPFWFRFHHRFGPRSFADFSGLLDPEAAKTPAAGLAFVFSLCAAGVQVKAQNVTQLFQGKRTTTARPARGTFAYGAWIANRRSLSLILSQFRLRGAPVRQKIIVENSDFRSCPAIVFVKLMESLRWLCISQSLDGEAMWEHLPRRSLIFDSLSRPPYSLHDIAETTKRRIGAPLKADLVHHGYLEDNRGRWWPESHVLGMLEKNGVNLLALRAHIDSQLPHKALHWSKLVISLQAFAPQVPWSQTLLKKLIARSGLYAIKRSFVYRIPTTCLGSASKQNR